MKFEYDDADSGRECVAYIDSVGHLVVLNTRSYHGGDDRSFVFMPNKSGGETTTWDKFCPGDHEKKFYPGDKITITF